MDRYDNMLEQHHLHVGADVFGVDGSKIGSVKTWNDHHLVVEKGLLFSTDYYVPFSTVTNYTEEEVYLSVTKDEALHSGWENEPVEIQGFTENEGLDGDYAHGPFRQNAFEVEPELPPRQRTS